MLAHISDDERIQTVSEHSINTTEYAAQNGRVIGLENIMKLAGLLHDLGKNTAAFDDYIRASHNGEKTVKRGVINHSSAGARFLMSLECEKTMVKDKKEVEEQSFLLGCLQRLILSMLIDADRRDTSEFMSGKLHERISQDECKVFFERCLNLLENRLNSFECKKK